jgi:DNA-directed RNA polymerase beta subunit
LQILDKYLPAALGMEEADRKKKALFLGQMAEKLIELYDMGGEGADDKDHYANKRLKLAGDLAREPLQGRIQELLQGHEVKPDREGKEQEQAPSR